jgi:ligand-binding sensor domain-containing protein
MVSAPDGMTWVVAGNGLYRYDPSGKSLTLDENVSRSVTCAEAEANDYIWLGTSSEGIIRYDWINNTRVTLDENDGLTSNTVSDLSLDAVNGYMWIVTSDGLSRYDMAYTNTVITDNRKIAVYPNPFSFSDPSHTEILIRNVSAQSRVHIYDVRGVLVKTLDPVSQNMAGWVFRWAPDRRIMPGTYFCTAGTNSTSGVNKILIVP